MIHAAPKDMTAEQYRTYQGGEITGYLQSYVYCRKIFDESNERLKQAKQSFHNYLNLLAEEGVNNDPFGEYEIEDCIDTETEEIEAYSGM